MTELTNDSIRARHFQLPRETSDNLEAVAAQSLTDLNQHFPARFDRNTASTNAALPSLTIDSHPHLHPATPSDLALSQTLDSMIMSGNANGLQRELQSHTPEELRGALRQTQDHLALSGVNLTTDWKYGKPVVYIEAAGGHTSIDFNDPFSVGHVPMVGTRDGGMRRFAQGAAATPDQVDGNLGLRRVFEEAEAARRNK